MERNIETQQILDSWNKSCKVVDDVDQEAKEVIRQALELKIAEEQGLLLRLPCKVIGCILSTIITLLLYP